MIPYFMLKTLFVLEILNYLSWLFGYVKKQLDKKARVNFKICNITDFATSNYYTHIVQYLKKTMSFGQLLVYNMINVFLEKSFTKCSGQCSLRPFYKNIQHIFESTV